MIKNKERRNKRELTDSHIKNKEKMGRIKIRRWLNDFQSKKLN